MTLPALEAAEFPAFFKALHGHSPFTWQARLTRQIVDERDWPCILDVPTGSGKTATIDVAVFHLALEAHRAQDRRAPLRVAFVIDRRVVVDAAFQRASYIADCLQGVLKDGDSNSVLWRVAKRLTHLSGGDTPLLVRALRGGVPRENDWARTPSQPTVLCFTMIAITPGLLLSCSSSASFQASSTIASAWAVC